MLNQYLLGNGVRGIGKKWGMEEMVMGNVSNYLIW
jgi:hypothetical protein